MDEKALAALEALKQKYLESLPEKIDDIRDAWMRAQHTKTSTDIETVYRNAHSLAGSGATFGQETLGKKAKTLELYIKEKNDAGTLFSEESIKDIVHQIDELYILLGVTGDKVKLEANAVAEKAVAKPKQLSPLRSMEVLVVEDDEEVRQRLAILLESMGHRVVQASDGTTAIDAYEANHPELILMDVVMPDMGGEEATRIIKERAGNSFIPVIFVTSLNDMHKLADLVEAGGDDFLIKPVDPVVLTAKMNAFTRISEMYKKLDAYQRETEDELETSKHLLNTLLNIDTGEVGDVNVWASSPGHFSGDLRLIRKRDDGEVLVLLCDFTGHGLPAAIGTIFVADLFRSMTKKAFSADIILNEINEKMYQILPTGRYCAATMISYRPDAKTLSIWNCGLPTLYLLDENHQIVERVDSGHVPLGVIGGSIKSLPLELDAARYDSVVLFSDGVTEAENPEREMYGEERLIQKIESVPQGSSVFHVVRDDIEKFMSGAQPSDDISFIVLSLR